ncbi:topoisomerase [Advenella kashmirensis W13003]|uniref:Topoisomerase n=1 Tax=Advenella kashmirensis W13003 TaxID=1424334 RepID=V8QLQ7_9BURK|nr:topoisomerase [Advenella kashmirensis W13003]
MGAGIKSELGEGGFEIWDAWSQQAGNYNAKSAKSAWKSLKPGRVNIGTVFFEAKRAGYVSGSPYTPPSPQEQAAREQERRIAEEKALAQRAVEAAQAKADAQSRWEKAGAADPKHPYLVAKGITDMVVIGAIRQDGNQLLVPLRQNKELVALQSIGPNGFKSFAQGSQVQGSAFLIGHPKEATSERGVLVAEGFATAASLHQATGQPVLMAVHAYNMKPVAETLKGRMPDIPVTFCADNDTNGVGIKYAEQAAGIVGDKAQAMMPEFTDADFAAFRQKHGPEAIPSDFNDLAQVRGLDAVKQGVVQSVAPQAMGSQNSPEFAEQTRQEVPASVFGPQEQNRIEPDLDQVMEKEPSAIPSKSDQVRTSAGPNPDIMQPSRKPTITTASAAGDVDTSEHAQKKPILNLAYKAPPDGLEVRYLFVDGKYVDAGNGVTTIFQDKGKYLATAKEDIQTVHDMVEVAKAKGWERLKLSGTPEFKRLMYIEAESQGIKTRGYQPAAEDLAMVNKRQEERSLNQVQADLHDNRRQNKGTTPRQDAQATSAADRFASQNELPTKSQIESSPKADVDPDVRIGDIGSQSIPSEVKIAADQMRAARPTGPIPTDKPDFYSRLNPSSQGKFRYMKSMADTVIGYLRQDRGQDAQRNFNDNMEKAINGSALNVPAPMRERAEQASEKAPQQQEREYQQDRTLER